MIPQDLLCSLYMASWHLVSQMYTSIQKMQNLRAEKVSSLKDMITSMLLFCEGVGAQPSDVTFPTSKIGLCDIGTNPFGPVSNPGLCKPTKTFEVESLRFLSFKILQMFRLFTYKLPAK